MVVEAMGALAADSLAHIVGEGPLINAEKEFDRFMKSYEFAIEAQKLKREDIKSLMELVVDRMDMYHLIGALLLEFCVGFYGEFKMLEEDYVNEPKLIMEIFLLSNIAAVGYLLFAIWLSLHASVAAHAIGVEFLLDCNRLTVPTPENLREMRQATSLFRSTYRLFKTVQRRFGPGSDAASSSGLGASVDGQPEPKELTLEALASGQPLAMPRLRDDLQKLEHRGNFAQHHRAWLRFDAYSRVSMALGINQMLQSMSYFIAGPVQKHRPSFALITVIGVQAIAFFLLKLDWRSMDTDSDDEEVRASPVGAASMARAAAFRDVSSLPCVDFFAISVTNLLPPVWMVLILWLAHFMDSTNSGNLDHQGRLTARVLATPIFFLHAWWLYLVRTYIAPHAHDLLPVRLRTVGYLEVFMRDAKLVEQMEEEEEPRERPRRRRGARTPGSRVKTSEAALKTVQCCDSVDDIMATVDWEEEYLGAVETSSRRRRDMSPDMEAAKGHATEESTFLPKPKQKIRGHDHVAWLVVGRFTTTMIWLWIAGGFVHISNCLLDLGGQKKDLNGNIHKSLVLRKLSASWPEPANFFEVTNLHCNSSGVVIGSPFAVHAARHLESLESLETETLGPLAKIGDFEAKAAWCGGGGCRALAAGPEGRWQLRSLEAAGSAEDVPLPASWRLVAGAPAQAGELLAAWDGERVVISSLSPAGVLAQRFAVHPSCEDEEEEEEASRKPGPGEVRGLYVDTSSGCQTLAVLRDLGDSQRLESWDLAKGQHLGCWRLGAGYGALCQHGARLLLARRGPSGPSLESAQLPSSTPCAAAAPASAAPASAAPAAQDENSPSVV